jgi:hypothetical protein
MPQIYTHNHKNLKKTKQKKMNQVQNNLILSWEPCKASWKGEKLLTWQRRTKMWFKAKTWLMGRPIEIRRT